MLKRRCRASEKEDHQLSHTEYFVYPAVLCPFPQAVLAPIRDMFEGELMLVQFQDSGPVGKRCARVFEYTCQRQLLFAPGDEKC